jgi:hypothetical protein
VNDALANDAMGKVQKFAQPRPQPAHEFDRRPAYDEPQSSRRARLECLVKFDRRNLALPLILEYHAHQRLDVEISFITANRASEFDSTGIGSNHGMWSRDVGRKYRP